jgi:hypothetical protein
MLSIYCNIVLAIYLLEKKKGFDFWLLVYKSSPSVLLENPTHLFRIVACCTFPRYRSRQRGCGSCGCQRVEEFSVQITLQLFRFLIELREHQYCLSEFPRFDTTATGNYNSYVPFSVAPFLQCSLLCHSLDCYSSHRPFFTMFPHIPVLFRFFFSLSYHAHTGIVCVWQKEN